MKVIALIPARYAASRFPGKLLKMLGDKTVIAATYLAVKESQLFDHVAIVTDSEAIERELQQYNATVFRSEQHYECGTDRIAAVAHHYGDEDIIINVQGDEPFINTNILTLIINELKNNPEIAVCSVKEVIKEHSLVENPNIVKVVCDLNDHALLFSRSVIPFHREVNQAATYYKHIGIYGFRQEALAAFADWPQTPLELLEKQEAMRFLEHGYKVKVLTTDLSTQGIDTEEDLIKANRLIQK